MAKIQTSTNLYTPNTIIVDAGGTTPFTTVAAGITAAVGLGASNPTVYIRAGTYTENLTLVNGVNLCGDDKYTTIIDGHHTVPAAGQVQISNLKLAASVGATSVFIEAGAGTCAIDVMDCIFNITSGMVFNLPLSTGPLSIMDCSDISAANSIIDNTTGLSILTIEDSSVGSGAVAAIFAGATYISNSRIICPISRIGVQTLSVFNSQIAGTVTLSGTSTVYMANSNMDVGAVAALNIGAGCTATLCNVSINSSVAGSNCIIGAGTCVFGEVTYINAAGVTVTTKDYTTRVGVGELQIDPVTGVGALYGVAGLVTATGAMTNGQILVGSTGNPPALATISAGSGISVTNGAGTISIASTASGLTWSTINADGTIASDTGRINIKAGALLTVTLPVTAAVGKTMILQGSAVGSVGWKIAQNAGQNIQIGNQSTTIGVGGSLASTNVNDSISLVCTVADTTWNVFSAVGNLTVV